MMKVTGMWQHKTGKSGVSVACSIPFIIGTRLFCNQHLKWFQDIAIFVCVLACVHVCVAAQYIRMHCFLVTYNKLQTP